MRIDKFLKNSRIIKRRTVAKDACEQGRIFLNDKPAKPGAEVKVGDKVFVQDYKTIANFSFGAGTADTDHDGAADTPGGFGNAYVTIPDLRTPKLELGFSVDLHWQEGITFTHEF